MVRLTFTVSITISNSTGHAILQETTDFFTANEILFTERSLQAIEENYQSYNFQL